MGGIDQEVSRTGTTVVDVAVPVYNEESNLERNIKTLRAYLDKSFPFPSVVTIVDNASTDSTWVIASRLQADIEGVQAMHLDQKGKGRAVRHAWTTSSAPVVAYMDIDLSTGLNALLPLIAPLLSGHSDLSIGSRLAHGAHVQRSAKRELISRCNNILVRWVLGSHVWDAKCGFKAMRADVARELLPLVKDNVWFFDTELVVLAQRTGRRVHQVPVDWTEDEDSRVDVMSSAIDDLKGIARMLRGRRKAAEVVQTASGPGHPLR